MTQPDTIVTINLGDSTGDRKLAFTEVQRAIGEYLNAANFEIAASI